MDGLKIESLKPKIWLLVWLLIFGVGLAWRAQNLDAFGLTNDEGAYLMWSQLPLDGYPLYSETRAVQPPLFFEWVGLALRWGGPQVAVARWSTLVSYGLLAVALSWLAYRDRGRVAALTVVVLLSLTPLIFRFSRLVMAEVPATALAVVALAWLVYFSETRRRGWLVASGLAFGASLLVKALNPFMMMPVALLLVVTAGGWRSLRWRALFFNSLSWVGGLLLPLLVVLLFYDRVAMFDQTVAFRGDLRAAIPGSWAETWTQFSLMLQTHWGLWLLAGGGLVAAVLRWGMGYGKGAKDHRSNGSVDSLYCVVRSAYRFLVADYALRTTQYGVILSERGHNSNPLAYPLLWAVWLGAGLAMLAWHTPLFTHHLVVLFPPLILLGSGLVADGWAWWRQRSGLGFFFLAVLVVALLNLPAMIAANQAEVGIVTGGREAEAMRLLQAVTAPTDFVMGDSQLLIYMAGRRTPPPLGDVALVAIKAGRQTAPRMIALTKEYRAGAVAQWSLRLPWLPDYLAWVEANYLARRVWDNDHIIYFVPRLPVGQPLPNPQMVPLGGIISLRGHELAQSSAVAGQPLTLKLYWQAETPPPEDYTVFTQLLDGSGALAVGWDSQPLGGHFPTSQWPVGQIVTDVVQIPLPAELPPGEYTLITGLYRLATLERLTGPDGSDFVTLSVVTVINP